AELVADLADSRDRLDLLDADDGPLTDIRAVLSWSYHSLPPETAHTFRTLALLPGVDADALAISTLCDQPVRTVQRHLTALARAHLVTRTEDGRYRQHDLLRAYALELTRAAEGADAASSAHDRLLEYYTRSAA